MATNPAAPANLPVPLLMNALTGASLPPMPFANLAGLLADLPGAAQRIANSTHLATNYTVDDPNELTQAGWGALFASDADPAIQLQLKPLLDMRQSQVQDPNLFKIFSGPTGVGPGQTAENWASERGVSLGAPVDPYQGGVPFYLLIVGSPERIPFEFQALLKLEWAVGRLHFDDIDDFGRYAQAVVDYESPANKPIQRKNAAIWVTRNPGDLATALLSSAISQGFLDPSNALGSRTGFTLDAFPNEKATQAQLKEIFRGNLPGGPPAVLFTGSHGSDFSGSDPAVQRKMQGALATQEWLPGTPADSTNVFSAGDIPRDAKVRGSIAFLFACFSGGCPTQNSYYFNPDGSRIPLAPAPMISALSQALLSRGALAVIGHVDMAFPYAFRDVNGTPQVEAIRNPLELLLRGKRVGLAADSLSLLWSSLSAQVGVALGAAAAAGQAPVPAEGVPETAASAASLTPADQVRLSQLTLARDDARNYIVLGDPAVKLRVEDLS